MTEEQRIAEEMRKAINTDIDAMFLGEFGTFGTTSVAPDKPLTREDLMQAIERARLLMQTPNLADTVKFTNLSAEDFGCLGAMGFNLISSNHLVDRIRQRRHRRKRINKKWLKRYGYRKVPKKDLIRAGNTFYGHPLTIQRVKHLLANGVRP